MKQGESIVMEEYSLEYVSNETVQQPHRLSRVATLKLTSNNQELGIIEPRLNNYFRMGTVIGTPAVKIFMTEMFMLTLSILMRMVESSDFKLSSNR